MDTAARLALCVRLAAELKRLDMRPHVKSLRTYYAEVRAGQPRSKWIDEHVTGLCETLRVPPFENALPVHPRLWVCCPGAMNYSREGLPTATRMWCNGCKAEWLVLTP